MFKMIRVLMISLFFAIALNAANIKIITKYGKTGGIAGRLNTTSDKINGRLVCQNNPTPGCDFANDPGWSDNGTPNDGSDDTYSGDLIVRTNDLFEVVAAWSWNGDPDANEDTVTLKSTLPRGYEWSGLPGSCNASLSSLSDDRRSIVCVRKDFDKNQVGTVAEDLTFTVRVLGSNPNGAQPGDISFEISAPNATAQSDNAGVSLTVTAAPRWNLQKSRYWHRSGVEFQGQKGYLIYYKFYVEVDEVDGETDDAPAYLGSESMGADATFIFKDDLSDVSPNAKLYDCLVEYGANSNDPYPYYNADYPERSIATPKGVQKITCNQNGSLIDIKLEHVDATLNHIPRYDQVGRKLPVNRAIATIGSIRVFVPLQDVKDGNDHQPDTDDDGQLQTINKLINFDPTAPSGNSNFGSLTESEKDNSYSLTLYYARGGFSKGYAEKHGVWSYREGGSAGWRTGDGLLSAGAVFASRLGYTNEGGIPFHNSIICDVIDANRLEVINVPAGSERFNRSGAFDIRVVGVEMEDLDFEYASTYVNDSWLPSKGGDLNANHAADIVRECSDSSVVWYNSLEEAKQHGLGTVTKVRIKLKPGKVLEPGGNIYAWLNHRVRAKTLDGEALQNGDEIVNYATVKDDDYFTSWYQTSYIPHEYPNPPEGWAGDRVTYSGGKVRIEKSVNKNNFELGQKAIFTLNPSYTNDTGTKQQSTVIIKDMLPVGLHYVPSSVQNAPEPTIGTCNDINDTSVTCTNDNQVLIWNLGTKTTNEDIAPISYEAQIESTASQGTLTNYAYIESPADVSVVSQRRSEVNINITIPATINLAKTVLNTEPQETNGEPIRYAVDARNGSDVEVTELDIIDILPFNGDGNDGAIKFRDLNLKRRPGTHFNGTRAFESLKLIAHPKSPALCDLSPGVHYYYTNAEPTTINMSPKDTSNALGSRSIWCEGDENGPAASCGFTKAEVTAVRAMGPSMEKDAVCQMQISMRVQNNQPDDFYNNSAGASATGVTLPVLSNSASTVIVKSKVGDYIWFDANANGVQDAGESGINDIEVKLYKNDGTLVATTKSANDADGKAGYYAFDNLHSGDYYIQITPPSGFHISPKDVGSDDEKDSDIDAQGKTAQFHLGIKSEDLKYDAGIYKPSSIGSTIWYDTNHNGIRESGEDCRNIDLNVSLLDSADHPIQTQTTHNCHYLFTNLLPGTYKVKVDLPQGFEISPKDQGSDSTDSDFSTTHTTDAILINNGIDKLDVDLGFYTKSAIGDRIWLDSNANGIQDQGEKGVADVTIELLKADGTATGLSTKSDANGNYRFENLLAGDYKVKFTLPSGYKLSPKDSGDDTKDSDVDQTLMTPSIHIDLGTEDMSWDLGLYQEASIGDRIWIDSNSNGIQDSGEDCDGIEVKVTLHDELNSTKAVTTQQCQYKFDKLIPNRKYYITVEFPEHYTPGKYHQGSDSSKDSDIKLDGSSDIFTLVSGEDRDDVDIALVKDGAIGDLVWLDINKNGIQDPDEGGVASIDVELLNEDNSSTNLHTTTDSNGIYSFNGIKPGSYRVKFTIPDGYHITSQNQGRDENRDSDVKPETGISDSFTIVSDQIERRVDLGLYTDNELGDLVWFDSNDNGIQDPDEKGVADVNVTLIEVVTKKIVSQTITDHSGNYIFRGLKPGRYLVKFGVPNGYGITVKNRGDDSKDSDVNFETNTTDEVEIGSATKEHTVDMGLIALKSISGKVESDIDNDKKGEVPLKDVTVQLYSCQEGKIIQTTQTDEKGAYRFDGLIPDCYTVMEIDPKGYTSVSDIDDKNDNNITVKVSTKDVTGQNFLDEPLLKVSGQVRADMDFDNKIELGKGVDIALADVNVTLYEGDKEIASTRSDKDGNYLFEDITPGHYTIVESDPKGFDSLRDVDGANDNNISITLSTKDITGQNFDDQKTITVSGTVKVDIDGDRKVDEPLHNGKLLLCKSNVVCTEESSIAITYTDENGSYSFEGLKPGDYQIVQIDKKGYESLKDKDGGNSNIIRLSLDGMEDVKDQDFEDLAIAPMFVKIHKKVLKKDVKIGDFVPYSIRVENVDKSFRYAALEIRDLIPAGFRYVEGSAKIKREHKKAKKLDASGTKSITFGKFELKPKEVVTISYLLKVGVGVSQGKHTNKAIAVSNDEEVSNLSKATVRVESDPFVDNAVVVGKVFIDSNENGIQDRGERGIPGVRIATVEGIVIETDAYGRYHIADNDSGGFGWRGKNIVLKVDPATLPEGAKFTTENPRVYRVTASGLNQIDFGVKLPEKKPFAKKRTISKVVMHKEKVWVSKLTKLGTIYFDSDQDCIRPDQVPVIENLVKKIKAYGSGSIRIEGNTDARAPMWYNKKLAYKRALSVYKELKYRLGDEMIDKVDVIYNSCDKEVKFNPLYDWWGKPNIPRTPKECTRFGIKQKDCHTLLNQHRGGAQ